MRAINFTLFVVLIGSYIAMIGATPIQDGSLTRRQDDDDFGDTLDDIIERRQEINTDDTLDDITITVE
jgi:hypothetical protein